LWSWLGNDGLRLGDSAWKGGVTGGKQRRKDPSGRIVGKYSFPLDAARSFFLAAFDIAVPVSLSFA